MDSIKSIDEFKKFMQQNQDLVYGRAINADSITADDEWIQDDKWDEIYQEDEK